MNLAISEFIPNVDDWKDVLVVAMVVAGGWVTTWITLRRGQKRAVKSHDKLNETMAGIKDQVVNGHSTPMRSDLDDVRDMITDVRGLVVEQSRDMGRIRDDMHDMSERLRRVEQRNTQHDARQGKRG